jgi:hypothetical protein
MIALIIKFDNNTKLKIKTKIKVLAIFHHFA